MAYNLTVKGEQVRIGNWFEEIKLKQETGIRFYPDPRDAKSRALTYHRCIEHTDQMKPKDYRSVTMETIVDPKKHPNYRTPAQINSKGPRQLRLEQALMDEVAEETKAKEKEKYRETMKTDYTTVSGSAYQGSFSPGATGHSRTTTPGSATLRSGGYAPTNQEEMPITFYSYSISKPGCPVAFPTSFVGSTNAFKKSGAFSASVERDVLAVRSETYERPKSLPTVLEYRDLKDFKRRLLSRAVERCADALYADQGSGSSRTVDGRVMRDVVDTLWIASRNGFVTIDDLSNGWGQAYGVQMEAIERRAFIAAFDTKSLDSRKQALLSSLDIQGFLRGQPSAARMDMINLVFRSLDQEENMCFFCDPSQYANSTLVSAFLHATGLIAGKGTEPRDVTIDEFFDFYYDASAEIGPEGDDEFEQLLYRTWAEGN